MPGVGPIRILIADDHPIFRAGLRRLLQTEPGFHVVGEAGDGAEALALARQLKPDILLLDVAMPRVPGMHTLRQLSREPIEVRTILLTARIDKAEEMEAFRLGARGVVAKGANTDLLLRAVRAVMAGQLWIGHEGVTELVDYFRSAASPSKEPERELGLTAREQEVLSEILAGSTNKEIASKLLISTETVKRHLSNIYEKLGVSNRLELALFATTHKLAKD